MSSRRSLDNLGSGPSSYAETNQVPSPRLHCVYTCHHRRLNQTHHHRHPSGGSYHRPSSQVSGSLERPLVVQPMQTREGWVKWSEPPCRKVSPLRNGRLLSYVHFIVSGGFVPVDSRLLRNVAGFASATDSSNFSSSITVSECKEGIPLDRPMAISLEPIARTSFST